MAKPDPIFGITTSAFDSYAEHLLEHILFRRNWSMSLRDQVGSYIKDCIHLEAKKGDNDIVRLGSELVKARNKANKFSSANKSLTRRLATLEAKLKAYENENW